MAAVGQTEGRPAERILFGHPIGLVNLFGVELWERFSFYGMLTILGYYLYYSVTEGGLELPKATATGIVGAYGGLVYLSTVLGGWIADRLLGMEHTVFYGGVVVVCGHIALAVVPGLAGVAVGRRMGTGSHVCAPDGDLPRRQMSSCVALWPCTTTGSGIWRPLVHAGGRAGAAT
jgi:proton-dependent oligopeptide transporter, POT family